jgi:hypothetical protein
MASVITALSVGTVVYSVLERWSLVDSLYFSVVTLATVGFGDLHPTTDLAKLFTVLYIFAGVGIIAGFVSELTKARQDLHATDRLATVATTVHHLEADVESVVDRQRDETHGGGSAGG